MATTKLTTKGISLRAVNSPVEKNKRVETDSTSRQSSIQKPKTFSSGFDASTPSSTDLLQKKLDTLNVSSAFRARVLEQLKSAHELPLIQIALSGHNAERAITFYDELSTLLRKTPEAKHRLTPSIQAALLRSVSERRTPDDTGQAGLMGVAQAVLAAQSVAAMPQKQFQKLNALLSAAGGAAADTERGLLLKSVAARAEQLRPSQTDDSALARGQVATSQADRAMEEISLFAKEIRGLPRALLMRSTTLLDIESQTNTSDIDPLKLISSDDARSDNDGLYQRFETSCVPTTAQLTMGEIDPIFARKLWVEMGDKTERSLIATQQLDLHAVPEFFEADGTSVALLSEELAAYQKDGTLPEGYSVKRGTSSLRIAQEARAFVTQLKPRLEAMQHEALRSYLFGNDMTRGGLEEALKALETLRQHNNGQPTDELVQLMRANPPLPNTLVNYSIGLNALANTSNAHFWESGPVVEAEASPTTNQVDSIEALLVNGKSVPIRIGTDEGGHAMLASDVRGIGPEKKILISDPYSGRTAWVLTSEILDADSKWPTKYFELSWPKLTGFYVEVRHER